MRIKALTKYLSSILIIPIVLFLGFRVLHDVCVDFAEKLYKNKRKDLYYYWLKYSEYLLGFFLMITIIFTVIKLL